MKQKVKIVAAEGVQIPQYATPGSAGMDLHAFIKAPVYLHPNETILIPTGLKIQLPEGYEAQIRPRSGLALKHGVFAILGTIDSDYRGRVRVIMTNNSKQTYLVNPGERIAQMVINKVAQIEWDQVEVLDETERGEGGFGHTGKN